MQDQSLAASGKYIYKPLESTSHIRVLALEPGTYGSDIHCSLREVQPGDGTIYTTISYVWGEPKFPCKVSCTGPDNISGILCVTESLHAALQKIRLVDQPLTVWADAICINQDDLDERSQQVLLMRKIYSESLRLFVWLGEHGDLYGAAFDFISYVLEKWEYPPGPVLGDPLAGKSLTGDFYSKLTDEVLSSLDLVFGNSWFRRAWTFQEILCVPEATILAGDRTIPYEDLANFANLLHILGGAFRLSEKSSHQALAQLSDIKEFRNRPIDLLSLITMTRSRQATDLRDKLYSLIAIASDAALLPYQPDYRIAVGKVYQDFTVAWIAEYESLNVLFLCMYSEDALGTPSWVPNLAPSKHIPIFFEFAKDPFEACGPYDESKRLSVRDNTLSAPGLLVEKIAKSASRTLEYTFRVGDQQEIQAESLVDELHIIREALQIMSMPCWRAPEPIRKQAFWRTLLGGIWTDNCRLRQHHEKDFNGYWDFMGKFDSEKEHCSPWDDYNVLSCMNVEKRVTGMARERRFCMSESGRMGWIPKAGKEGDIISVLYECFVPVLLRPKGNAYEVIGTCYIHGIMDGEAVAAAQNSMQQIDLV